MKTAELKWPLSHFAGPWCSDTLKNVEIPSDTTSSDDLESPSHASLEHYSLPIELLDYCKALERLYAHGFVECYGYQIAPGVLEEAVVRQKPLQLSPAFFVELFRHPLVSSDFSLNDVDEPMLFARENWTYYSPFLFSGCLAQTLVAGGAYYSMGNDIGSALEIADKAFRSLNRNYQNLELHACYKPWCHYFFDVAWDHTWVIFDREIRRLFVLIASDTD